MTVLAPTTPAVGAIQRAAKAQGLDWRPLAAVAHYESGLNPRALGDGGHAFGLFQNNNAGGTITGDPNPQRFYDPNVSATYAARAVAKLGIGGMTPARQVAAIVNRYERPAEPQPEIQGALQFFNQNYAKSNPFMAAAPVAPAAPVRAAAPGTPAPAAPTAPSPILQASVLNSQNATQGAYDALANITGQPALEAQPFEFHALAPKAPSDHVVPLRGPVPKTVAAKLDTQGKKAVALAKQFIGTPYLYGGANPKTGFDCSGLLQYVWNKNGVAIPHNAAAQYDIAKKIPEKALQPGDAVFFSNTDGPGVTHVGMFIGNGQFIQAPHTGDHIKISKLSDPYYQAHFTSGGRFT